jgi:hypothetical protein
MLRFLISAIGRVNARQVISKVGSNVSCRLGGKMIQDKNFLLYRKTIQSLIAQSVPSGKSLDGMLEELAERWNPLFDTQGKRNLVEDVNALVRDYVRPLRHSFQMKPPDMNRLHALAEQLSASKGLTKIRKKDSLIRYLELFMLKSLD